MGRNLFAGLGQQQASQQQQAPAQSGKGRNLLVGSDVFPSVQPTGPVTQDEEKFASYGQRAMAQFADDPDTQMKYYAKQIQEQYFPDMTPEQVYANNMRVMDGKIAFTLGEPANESGTAVKYYYAEPQGAASQIMQEGPAMLPEAVLGGTLATGGAVSPVPGGAVGGAALGAAGGEGIRKSIANLVLDEPQTAQENLLSMGESAAWGAAGERFFRGIGSLFRKSAVKDIDNVDWADAQKLQSMADEYGITLTPAQVSGLQSLMARQKVLMNSPESQDIMQKFFQVQNEQIQKGVYQLFENISAEGSPRAAFQKGQKALLKRKQDLVNRRKKVADKAYADAFESQDSPVDLSEFANYMKSQLPDAASGQQRSINAVLKEVTNPQTGELKTNLRALHNAKVEIDRLIKGAQRGSGAAANMNVALLQDAQDRLLRAIDSQSPGYAKARKKYEVLSQPINKLDESLAGDLMEIDPRKAVNFGKTLFNSANSPVEVGRTMKMIRNMDPQAADDVLRGYLQNVFEKTLKETQQGVIEQVGGKARKAMFGSKLDQRMLRAAMTPKQYRTFTDVMDLLQATTRGMSRGSDTTFNTAQERLMKEESKGTLSKAADVATFSKQRIMNTLDDIRYGKYTKEMAELFTSGGNLMEFRKAANVLKNTDPSSKKYWSALGTVVGSITGQSFDISEESSQ